MKSRFGLAAFAGIALTSAPLPACGGGAVPAYRAAFTGDVPEAAPDAVGVADHGGCGTDGPGPESNAGPAEVAAIAELSRLANEDRDELARRVDSEFAARVERAAMLHTADAPPPIELPDASFAADALRDLIVNVPSDCDARYVADERRIDFPPPFVDTPEANAREIDEVHRLIYAAREVTLYCGPCARYVILLEDDDDGRVVVRAFADVR